ncbi:MAG TPA: UDP-N-acetylmuramoyl-tripeptide--D-alanyl-D-alanine ligase [Burkholderiales bacterium]|nr:UDP-N-acetylmuramoyl-tripeptide--D-alanyl-D-alanine ligase [Burkholderiales bacterium]
MMSLREAARAIGAGVRGEDVLFESVSTDSRTLARNALFVALRGERFDAHRFIGAARERGAVAAMVDQDSGPGIENRDLPFIVVENTRLALGRLAAQWRARFEIPLIVVTGSNGKTTVKEMIAAILRAYLGGTRVLATEGNLNNEIGLPLTLLTLRKEHAAAVIELGMNHPGETAYLAAIAAPSVALVNNAQREHQEFMSSVAEVAREHGAVFQALKPGGIAVINADDEFAGYWRGLLAGRPVRDFGIDRPAQVTGRFAARNFGSEIELSTPEGTARIALSIDGRHNVLNALAAAACALAAGAHVEAVVRGLNGFRAVGGRTQRRTISSGASLIDDSYNANPDSLRAAIDVLAAFPEPRLLVLGDMGEVGARGAEFHEEIGQYARQRGIDRLYAIGDLSRSTVRTFGLGARHFAEIADLIAAVRGDLRPRATVLVKGSRFMRMERVVQALSGEAVAGKGH